MVIRAVRVADLEAMTCASRFIVVALSCGVASLDEQTLL
jgi:hypothetical protein